MSYNPDYPDPEGEDPLKEEICTQREAREFIKKHLKIGDSYYYQCVLPEIRHKFFPMMINYKRAERVLWRIRKTDLKAYVRRVKQKLIEKGDRDSR